MAWSDISLYTRSGEGAPLTFEQGDYNWDTIQTSVNWLGNNSVNIVDSQSIGGVKTFTEQIIGNISGNAGTVSNGVYTNGSYANPSWITSLAASKITGTLPGYVPYTGATSDLNLGSYNIKSYGFYSNFTSINIYDNVNTVRFNWSGSSYTLSGLSGTYDQFLVTSTTGVLSKLGRYSSTSVGVGTSALGAASGGYNSGYGARVLINLSTGAYNTAGGYEALGSLDIGSYNVSFGYLAGNGVSTGTYNTFVGALTGTYITTGSNNTIIGANVGFSNISDNIIISTGDGFYKYRWDSLKHNLLGGALIVNPNGYNTQHASLTGTVFHVVGSRALIDATADGSALAFRRQNGTLGSPTALLTGENIGGISSYGYYGSDFTGVSTGSISFRATENWSSGGYGTKIVFAVTKNTTTSSFEAMTLGDDGSLYVNTTSQVSGLTSSKLTVVQGASTADYTALIKGATTTGSSYGLQIRAGTNTSDYGLVVADPTGSTNYLTVRGDGLTTMTAARINGFLNTYASEGGVRLFNAGSTFFAAISNDYWAAGGSTTDLAIYSQNNMYLYANGGYAGQITTSKYLLMGYTTSQGSYVGQFNGDVLTAGTAKSDTILTGKGTMTSTPKLFRFGDHVLTTVIFDDTGYVEIEINGTVYWLAKAKTLI